MISSHTPARLKLIVAVASIQINAVHAKYKELPNYFQLSEQLDTNTTEAFILQLEEEYHQQYSTFA